MSGNFAIKGGWGGVGGVGRLMANAILNFHFDYPHTSLTLIIWFVLLILIFVLVSVSNLKWEIWEKT